MQEESYEAMKSLANSIQVLSGQLNRLKEIRISNQLYHTITELLSSWKKWSTSFGDG